LKRNKNDFKQINKFDMDKIEQNQFRKSAEELRQITKNLDF